MLVYAKTPILMGRKETGWAAGKGFVPSPESPAKCAIQVNDTEVLSVQPDGSFQTRALDAIGPYESGTVVEGCWVVAFGLETPSPSIFVIPVKDGV